jgi:hypothetical protein
MVPIRSISVVTTGAGMFLGSRKGMAGAFWGVSVSVGKG